MAIALTARQADGQACVRCGLDYTQPGGFDVDNVPVGTLTDHTSDTSTQVFACRTRCADKYTSYLAIRASFPDPTGEAGAVSVEVAT